MRTRAGRSRTRKRSGQSRDADGSGAAWAYSGRTRSPEKTMLTAVWVSPGGGRKTCERQGPRRASVRWPARPSSPWAGLGYPHKVSPGAQESGGTRWSSADEAWVMQLGFLHAEGVPAFSPGLPQRGYPGADSPTRQANPNGVVPISRSAPDAGPSQRRAASPSSIALASGLGLRAKPALRIQSGARGGERSRAMF